MMAVERLFNSSIHSSHDSEFSLLVFIGTKVTNTFKCAEIDGINRLVGSKLLSSNLRFSPEYVTARGISASAKVTVRLVIGYRES